MKFGVKKRFLLFASLFLLFISAIAIIPFNNYYVFIHNQSDRLAAYVPVEEIDFQIKYIHSIHLSEVVETFRLLPDGSLMITELEYSDFAVGMPSNAAEGEVFVAEDGKYFIKNMSTRLPEYRLFIGDIDEKLFFSTAGKDVDLKKTLERGASYTFRVERLTVLQTLKGVNLNEQ